MSFLIIQHDRSAKTRRSDARLGVLTPVNLDGVYARQEDAEDVARFMAGQRPDLETFVVQAVRKVTP